MATTSPDNIIYPVGTDAVAPLHTVFANLASSTQTALTNLGTRFPVSVASDAARAAMFPSPVQGNRVYRTDKGYHEAYFAAYNASTNISGARIAGWYPIDGNIFAKVRQSGTFSITGANSTASFNSVTGTLPGMWGAGDATRLYLPIVGMWELKGFITTSGGDGAVLRSDITLNGAAPGGTDVRDNVSGISGINDPFANPHGVLEVQNTSSSVQLILSEGGKSSVTAVSGTSLWAKYLGPGKF